MQIIPNSAAANVASVVAQGTSKDRGSNPSATAGAASTPKDATAHVEKTGTSNPDRDAQGQGDGLPGDRRPRDGEQSQEPSSQPLTEGQPYGLDDDLDHLDIVG